MSDIWIDGHVNIHASQFDADREEVIQRARAAGIRGFLAICDQLSSHDQIEEIIADRRDFGRSLGVHPHYADQYPDLIAGQLEKMAAQNEKIWAIGETGLDFHYGCSSEAAQLRSFETHIRAAKNLGLPLIIHSREADQLMSATLQEYFGNPKDRGTIDAPFLLHCFTSGRELLHTGLELGGYISFTGIVTFKNAQDVRDHLIYTPDDRILIETDCPYLAPVPHRGRRCEPAHLTDVASEIGRLKGWSLEETRRRSAENFFRFYKKAVFPDK